ncbi:type II toxin-antitoxin system HipA family toxin [bacterium]|nr:type II toxin-antitoxin system HipA family toxin [bacterium]
MKGDRRTLQVLLGDKVVGTLGLANNYQVAFEYTDEWIETGFSISPFSLPLKKEVFLPTKEYFDGLFGVFADSLPDAWGRLLLRRLLKEKGKKEDELTVLDRLAIVGDSGMGALTYRPQQEFYEKEELADLDELAVSCQKILNMEYSEKLDELYRLGGTSGGARPKIMTKIDDEDWIIKFPAHVDGRDAGVMEYEYALCARKCGISMSDVKLFPSKQCRGYFGTRRFDRNQGGQRVHMLTAAALLELDFTQPSLDYHSLMKLTSLITGNNEEDMDNMFRRMCFNVFAHNRDDHSKNFTYLYNEQENRWRLSPAYDLTYSNTYFGEHTTTVDGNGRNPGIKELMEVGKKAGLKKDWCREAAEEIRVCVNEMLGEYLQ